MRFIKAAGRIVFFTFLLFISCSVLGQFPTVQIGVQTWSRENLSTTKFRNGDIIPEATTKEEWNDAWQNGKPAWCYYDFNPLYGAVYGRLYNWLAVKDPRGIAPTGYHVPTDSEWTILSNFLGGESKAAPALMEKDEYGSTNSSGFTGLPAGICNYQGEFSVVGIGSFWFTSTPSGADRVWVRGANVIGNFQRTEGNFGNGFSVRCVKDPSEPPASIPRNQTPVKVIKEESPANTLFRKGKFPDPRDGGENYPTIQLNKQEWLAENLQVVSFRNGDPVLQVHNQKEWVDAFNKGIAVWCYIKYDKAYEDRGKIYNWFAVSDKRGLAAEGWRIPLDADWASLIRFLGGEKEAIKKMKSTSGWAKGNEGNNQSGFNARPGGFCTENGYSYETTLSATWWSGIAPGTKPGEARFFSISMTGSNSWNTEYHTLPNTIGYTVRCVRDL